jgi:hypothetical protein
MPGAKWRLKKVRGYHRRLFKETPFTPREIDDLMRERGEPFAGRISVWSKTIAQMLYRLRCERHRSVIARHPWKRIARRMIQGLQQRIKYQRRSKGQGRGRWPDKATPESWASAAVMLGQRLARRRWTSGLNKWASWSRATSRNLGKREANEEGYRKANTTAAREAALQMRSERARAYASERVLRPYPIGLRWGWP